MSADFVFQAFVIAVVGVPFFKIGLDVLLRRDPPVRPLQPHRIRRRSKTPETGT
jgi:hypothetical protein